MDNEYIRPMNLYMGEGRIVLAKEYVLYLEEMLDRIGDLAIGIEEYINKTETFAGYAFGADNNFNEIAYKIKKVRELANFRQKEG